MSAITTKEEICNIFRKLEILKNFPDERISTFKHMVDRCNLIPSYEKAVNDLFVLADQDVDTYKHVLGMLTHRGEEVITQLMYTVYEIDDYVGKLHPTPSYFEQRFNYFVRSFINFVRLTEKFGYEKTGLFGCIVRGENLAPSDFLYCVSLARKIYGCMKDESFESLVSDCVVKINSDITYETPVEDVNRAIDFNVDYGFGLNIPYTINEYAESSEYKGFCYDISLGYRSVVPEEDCFVRNGGLDVRTNAEDVRMHTQLEVLMPNHPILWKYRLYVSKEDN